MIKRKDNKKVKYKLKIKEINNKKKTNKSDKYTTKYGTPFTIFRAVLC